MARRRWQRLDPDVRRQIIRLAAKGLSHREILDELDCSMGTVGNVLRPLGGVYRPELWATSMFRLGLEDRVVIYLGLERGESLRVIARRLGRAPSTVCREVARNGGRGRYRPMDAHHDTWVRTRRPKATKLAANAGLCDRVVADLEGLWSPQQIARRLADDFPDVPEQRVSHETIYRSLYCRAVVSCAANSLGACGPGAPNANPEDTASAEAASPT